MTNELVPQQGGMLATEDTSFHALDVMYAKQRYNAIVEFTKSIMQPGKDFGAVLGTDKPTLLKPGAEKLTSFFGLTVEEPQFVEKTEDWTGEQHGGQPFFYYLIRQNLTRGGKLVASQIGSCNSFEAKYRWRWVRESDIPKNLDKSTLVTRDGSITEFGFAVDKAETSGKYGKPAEYWQRFKDAIENHTAVRGERDTQRGKSVTWTIGTPLYRVPNDNVFDQVNTIQKMAAKRALVAVTLIACNASEFYTQDMEDMDMLDTGSSPFPASKTVDATSTPNDQPKKTDWMKLVAAAATLQAVRELARLAQEEVGYMPDELLHACQKRETELTPKPQTAPKTEQPKPATNGSRFDWNKATPAERTAYALKIVPTADGERIAKMSKIITPSVVGQENYRKIQEAMTARERELAQPQTEADPFGESEQIAMLRMLLQDKTTAADFDDMFKRWSEDSHSIDEPTFAQGVEIIMKARVSKGV